MKSRIIFLILALISFLNTNAQCAMCRAVLETEEGQSVAKGINNGIIYLMILPYILVGGVGYFVYKKIKSK